MSWFCRHKWKQTENTILTERQACYPNGTLRTDSKPYTVAIAAVCVCGKCGKIQSFKL